jgi:ABC-2 type transport system ATP-binding protein
MLGRDHTVILSTHILGEVQAVCDKIIIINKGRVVADERTEDIAGVLEGRRRYLIKIVGNQSEVMNFLKNRPGITYVEATNETDLDSRSFMIESEPGVDIRKSLFYSLAENNYPILGLESMGVNLEDIFLSLVDRGTFSQKSAAKTSVKKKVREEK